MKKFLKNRILPIVCALSILISLCAVPASAIWDTSRDVPDIDSVSLWEDALVQPPNMQLYANALFGGASVTVADVFWNLVNRVVRGGPLGEVGIDELQTLCAQYSRFFNQPMGESFAGQILNGSVEMANDIIAKAFLGKFVLTFEVRDWGTAGMKRIYCPEMDAFVVSSNGFYAYAYSAHLDTSGGNQWIGESTAEDRVKSGSVVLHDLARLNAMCNLLKEAGFSVQLTKLLGSDGSSKYYAIKYMRSIYADSDGRPFVAQVDTNEWASNQSRPDTSVKDEDGNPATDEDGNIIQENNTDNSTNIDLSGMTITLPDGKVLIADNIIYDESTKTYNIDSHDVTNNYITYNYSWTYHINYTSITYIGQTEEYNKYYEVYYELPDGRDSADLTAEEVEQLNVSVDVIPYGRSADDTSLRSLYHFDGDTKDSSYWNYCTDFNWNAGASLTYMESGTFEGCLYLDETEHDFDIVLPSDILSYDFTIQFRYYQSYTAAPQTDSYVSFGSRKLLQLDGAHLKNGSGTTIVDMPIGSWNEIALIRENGVLRYYLNGVYLLSVSDTNVYADQIVFHFGSSQQTYKQLDELRVLNKALVSGTGNYSPTSVPYDTNLTLVLPDSQVPIADEYWSISSGAENVLNGDFFQGQTPSGFVTYSGTGNYTYDDIVLPNMGIMSSHASVSVYDNYCTVASDGVSTYTNSGGTTRMWVGGLYSYVSTATWSGVYKDGLDDGTYTLSVVLADGTVCSHTFTLAYGSRSGLRSCASSSAFDWGTMGLDISYTANSNHYAVVYIKPETSVDIVYVELAPGDSTDLAAEFVTSVTPFDKDSLNTPTLAVRTDLDITSYQIGGVRPSLPTKGQVWALVENERITSIQIYNGSAWEACDGRIWTGERWVPASSYNIITLQDMYDIVDATQNYEYIYTESGFWAWWQKAWIAFTDKLFSVLGTGSGSGGSGGDGGDGSTVLRDVDLDADDEISNPDDEDGKSLWQFILLVIVGGKSVISGVRHMFSGTVSSVPGSMDSITSAFDSGGSAVGALDGTSLDPDAADLPATASLEDSESEVSDPWRYR